MHLRELFGDRTQEALKKCTSTCSVRTLRAEKDASQGTQEALKKCTSTCATLEGVDLLRSGPTSQMTGSTQLTDGPQSQDVPELKNRGVHYSQNPNLVRSGTAAKFRLP